ncbi:MAG TPA: M56 family metallopeptidase, partial [Longimicrobiaceae bacterium]|nr:M56 family metallopeptidase [Longimicrobiaceae bacterium]
MTPAWMLQALLAGALLGMAALAAEQAAGWMGAPRRGVWAAAMLGSLALPALSLWAPGLLPDLGIFPDPAPADPAPEAGAPRPLAEAADAWMGGPGADAGPFGADLSSLLGLGWLAASLAMLGMIGWSYGRLRAVRSGCEAREVDGVPVRVAERMGPAVVGLVRPVVVVPRWVLDAPGEERRLILLHEREHVASGDTWLLFLGTLAVAAMPWSLPLWWQQHRLRLAVETDCDARVLARGVSRRAYGEVLIRTAGGSPGLPPLSPAWGESTLHLERRIRAMTEKRPSHPLLRSLPLLAVAAGVLATACAVAGEGRSGDASRPAASARAEAAAPAVGTAG